MLDRLDKACRARILHETPTEVMLTASWPAGKHDLQRGFRVSEGIAFNTVVVSREYFNRRYGERP